MFFWTAHRPYLQDVVVIIKSWEDAGPPHENSFHDRSFRRLLFAVKGAIDNNILSVKKMELFGKIYDLISL